jgi:hypothetical protein
MRLVEEYIDFQTGREADKRADFQRLIEHAMEHRFDVVLVFHTSRFARNTVEAKAPCRSRSGRRWGYARRHGKDYSPAACPEDSPRAPTTSPCSIPTGHRSCCAFSSYTQPGSTPTVQLIRRERARTLKPGRPSPKYILRGLARCRRCHAKMQGTSGGRDLKARYYCSTRRANRSCDQPIIPAEQVEAQLARFLEGFTPSPTVQNEILDQLANPTATREDSQTTKHHAALEERLRRIRDLYELGDLHRAEYIARRDAINTELSALTPGPIPDLDQARRVLKDFTIFWAKEHDPANKRQFLTLIFENVWLDQNRIIAVQPKQPFLPFFQNEHRRPQTGKTAGVKYGSDGGRSLDCCLAD